MRLITLLALLLLAAPSFGETRYVSDHLVITLRTGQGNAYKILRSLPTGTALEVLEEDGDFVRVRTSKGTEGWVRAKYLVTGPVAKARLAGALQRAEQLQNEVRTLLQQVTGLKQERAQLSTSLGSTEKAKGALERELAELKKVAAQPLLMRDENRAMKNRIADLENELGSIGLVNEQLRDSSQREWFITGAGVLGSGIVLGLVLPLLRRRRQTSGWGDLR